MFDPPSAVRTISAALTGPGGAGLVLTVFAGVPGVIHTPARRGMFRSEPERVQIGSWRYTAGRDGRLRAEHVVNGIVLAEEVLTFDATAPHLVRALEGIVTNFGSTALPQLLAALDVLATAG